MNALACLMLLTAVMMARSDQVADFLKVHPHNDRIYFFDVTSEASVDDLKGALKNFTIDHSFRVIGEFRYFFVIQSNDTVALRHLKFPSDSKVMQYPVQHSAEYQEMFKVSPGLTLDNSDDHSSDHVLWFHEWVLDLPKTRCSTTFDMMRKAISEQYREGSNKLKPMVFPLLASYPPRFLEFDTTGDNVLQNMVRVIVSSFGGYGSTKVDEKRIVRN